MEYTWYTQLKKEVFWVTDLQQPCNTKTYRSWQKCIEYFVARWQSLFSFFLLKHHNCARSHLSGESSWALRYVWLCYIYWEMQSSVVLESMALMASGLTHCAHTTTSPQQSRNKMLLYTSQRCITLQFLLISLYHRSQSACACY
jgi:hypothetical protein